MRDVFTVECSAMPGGTRAVGFRGSEGISRPFALDLFLQIESPDFELADAVDARATFTVERVEGEPPFVFHGILADLELLHEFGGRATVRARLVPEIWQLGLSLHSRIFTNQSIPDILAQVLDDAGIASDAYTLRLSQSYKPQEHVCQYRESDLDFISRWMEREGMYYFFEHGDARETMIIADAKAVHEALAQAPIRFHALGAGDRGAGEALHTFTCLQRSLPARVMLKDYDFSNPTLDVSGSARVSKTGVGEVHVYGARFFTPDDGKRLAKLRSEELLSRETVFHGAGTAAYLRSGYLFELQGHGRPAFDAKYLAVEVEHHGNAGTTTDEVARLTGLDAAEETYRVTVTAIPEKTQFRAAQTTPWPRIYGFENGIVDGPADSEYAQIDDAGCYAIKFMFDEGDLKDGKASTWVRMLQPHGGGVEGFHFPLRKNTEVVLTFLGGDPDRPVIAGVVPNAQKPSPVTKTNHTTNVIQTGGRNRFELEDEKGSERITLSTPHKNTFLRMGAPNDPSNATLSTDGNAHINVGAKKTVTVDGGTFRTIKGGEYEDIYGGWTQEVTDGWTQTVTGPWLQTINGATDHTWNGDWNLKVQSGWRQTVGSGAQQIITGDWNFSASGAYNLTSAATMSQTVSGAVTLNWGPSTITTPSLTINSPVVQINGAAVSVKSSAVYKGFTPMAYETFGIKGAGGGLKTDHAAIALTGYGLKIETTGYAAGLFGYKGDTGINTKMTFATALKTCGMQSLTAAVWLGTAGIVKLGG